MVLPETETQEVGYVYPPMLMFGLSRRETKESIFGLYRLIMIGETFPVYLDFLMSFVVELDYLDSSDFYFTFRHVLTFLLVQNLPEDIFGDYTRYVIKQIVDVNPDFFNFIIDTVLSILDYIMLPEDIKREICSTRIEFSMFTNVLSIEDINQKIKFILENGYIIGPKYINLYIDLLKGENLRLVLSKMTERQLYDTAGDPDDCDHESGLSYNIFIVLLHHPEAIEVLLDLGYDTSVRPVYEYGIRTTILDLAYKRVEKKLSQIEECNEDLLALEECNEDLLALEECNEDLLALEECNEDLLALNYRKEQRTSLLKRSHYLQTLINKYYISIGFICEYMIQRNETSDLLSTVLAIPQVQEFSNSRRE